ncbi:MAG: hypothetical protein IJ224_01950 [Lachnospiraceae bacterium]|nr:hypothetical protein [Lachnospiraceae bacterium]
MSAKTKIVVLKSKEIIYTAIFVVLGILLISLLIYMFSPSKDKKKGESNNTENTIENSNTTSQSNAPDATIIPPQEQTVPDSTSNQAKDQTVAESTTNLVQDQTLPDSTTNPAQEQASPESDSDMSQGQPAPNATVIPPQETVNTSAGTYKSGVYSSIMNVGGQTELQLVVTVDNGRVSHLDITNLNETVTAMYPLIGPSLDELNSQLDAGASFENLTYSKDNQYTTILILQAAKDSLIVE